MSGGSRPHGNQAGAAAERLGWLRGELDRVLPADEVTGLARRLVQIPSHASHPGMERELAEFVAGFAAANGLGARLEDAVPGRPNVIVTLPGGPGGRTLMFNAHLDTVPPHPAMEEPFAARLAGGVISGLGAADTKGGLAAMLMAMVGLARAGLARKELGAGGGVVLTAVVDEEGRGEGTEAVIRSGLRADGAIVAEPTGLAICPGHKGLAWIEITVRGRAAHSGRREQGVNAVSQAAKLLVALETELVPRLAEREHPFLGRPTLNCGLIRGGTQPSTVPGECVIQLDRRTTPAEDARMMWSDFREVFDRLSRDDPSFWADIRLMPQGHATLDHLAFVTPLGHPLVRAAAVASAVTGGTAGLGGPGCPSGSPDRTVRFEPFPAWSDAGFLAVHAGIPAVVIGPGDLGCAHSPGEVLEVDQLLRAVEIYALTALAFGEELV